MITNALSIDLEDWRQIIYWKVTGERMAPDPEVERETDTALQMMDDAGVKATFFVLANVARTYPALVRRVAAEGHEIGSHGWSHMLVYRQTPDEFREETRQAKALLEDVVGAPVRGYRAAEFSITRRSWWALEVLAELGFEYDSSVFPIQGKRYGVPDAPLVPHRVETPAGAIREVPLTAVEWRGRRWPIGGGGYFRLFPYRVTADGFRKVNAEGRPAVVYLHPYEFAKRPLRIPFSRAWARGLPMLVRNTLIHNLARDRLRARFARLLAEFRFQPVQALLSDVDRNQTILG